MFVQNRLGLIENIETLRAHEERMNQVANNLANVDTAGYKKENITFWEMLYEASSGQERVGKALKVITDHQAGPAEQTGNPLDVAINGDGFFRIQTPQGIRYTRAGNFQLNREGQMVMPNGGLVLGDGGSVVVDGNDLTISRDGTVTVDGAVVNRLTVVSFADPAMLEKEGASLFRIKDPAAQEQEPEFYELQQGFVEASNTSAVLETTAMIDLMRAYETQQTVVRTIDEMDSVSISRVGKLTA